MNTDKIDYVWAAVSFIIVGVTFHYGVFLYGLLGIYLLFALLMATHIFRVKKRMDRTEAVYAQITDYREVNGVPKHFYPVVRYETTEGRTVSSVYTVAAKSKLYEVAEEELICYDPDDPVFFYFSSRSFELTSHYYRYMVYGGIPALFVIIAIFAH